MNMLLPERTRTQLLYTFVSAGESEMLISLDVNKVSLKNTFFHSST